MMSSGKNSSRAYVPGVTRTSPTNVKEAKPTRRLLPSLTVISRVLLLAIILIPITIFSLKDRYSAISFTSETGSTHASWKATTFSWDNIKPSALLQYHPCYDTFQCARLEVPLDWNSTLAGGGPKMAIAIVKKPAPVTVIDPKYGGVILLNPGGPGGSGVNLLTTFGDSFSTILDPTLDLTSTNTSSGVKIVSSNKGREGDSGDSSEALYFDLVSWDPRGVGYTTPAPNCYPKASFRYGWDSARKAIGIDLEDKSTYAKVWARETTYGYTCSLPTYSDSEAGHIGQYISTANEVGNMVEILERHGEWREKTAVGLVSRDSQDEARDRFGWRRGEEPLNYWGFSYGTILGQAFATMQPHRVRRVILDGNAVADDYMEGGWSRNLQDVDKITTRFAEQCWTAGRLKCQIWNINGPEAILHGVWRQLEEIRASPVARMTQDGEPEIWTYSDVIQVIFSNWYNAYYGFEIISNLLANLRQSDPTHSIKPAIPALYPAPSRPTGAEHSQDPSSGSLAIRCGDGQLGSNTTRESFTSSHLEPSIRQSALFGPLWVGWIMAPCAGYSVRPKWRFAGPFGARTAHPILFANTELDPVTPLRNAYANSALFPGSVVLETNGVGHCTVSMPSLGAIGAIRRYFASGELPPEGGRKFNASVETFGGGENGASDGVDARLKEAVVRFADRWPRDLH